MNAPRILIVDDSAVIRRYLGNLLEKAGYSVTLAKNGEEALKKHLKEPFDLITLDIEMPVMDGLSALRAIMKERPTRVLMISSYTTGNADVTFEALEAGALDYIPKPKASIEVAKISDEILQKVENALKIPMLRIKAMARGFKALQKPRCDPPTVDRGTEMGFVLIGASTGGPRLIERICKSLPADYPHAVCVVQHMPEEFTANFAKRLDTLSRVEVREADNGMLLEPGRVIIGKGGKHLHFRKRAENYLVQLASNLRNRFFVPSVDEMFFSAAEVLPPKKILAVELTGIGDDGADGMVALRKAGAMTIAESERTAIVYGMPKEAYERGGAAKVLDFDDIVKEILAYGC